MQPEKEKLWDVLGGENDDDQSSSDDGSGESSESEGDDEIGSPGGKHGGN
jgi:hypothetical protein